MALSDKDISRIREIVSSCVAAEFRETKELSQKLAQTVYGETGVNGLRKSVRDLVKWKYMATGAQVVVGSATFWKILSTLLWI